VGLPYVPGVDPHLYRAACIDFVEIVPDTLCGPQATGRGMALIPEALEKARAICDGLPVVVHGVDLSIGSARQWNQNYVDMLQAFQRAWPFQWHSEHLHFQTVDLDDGRGEIATGVPLPLPLTHEAIDLVAARALALAHKFDVPFLLENAAHYLGTLPTDDDIEDEAAMLNSIVARGQCGILLDLHNLHCNAVNNGIDAAHILDRLPLDRVIEIHVAGGSWADGFRLDAHDGLVPHGVWELLETFLPHCSNIAGLVFEIMQGHAEHVGTDAIADELARLRTAWSSHTAFSAVAS
jgi:uncharacterized protein (UPF0276 family)